MSQNTKALVAKCWKNEVVDLPVGRHNINQTMLVRVRGEIEKHDDQMVTPTVSIPFISVVAFLLERVGVERDEALAMLRDAIHEAMANGEKEDEAVMQRIEDVNAAIKSVRQDLIAKLPKMHRSGKIETNGLAIDVLAISANDKPLSVEAA